LGTVRGLLERSHQLLAQKYQENPSGFLDQQPSSDS
jgi:hypothetical protein